MQLNQLTTVKDESNYEPFSINNALNPDTFLKPLSTLNQPVINGLDPPYTYQINIYCYMPTSHNLAGIYPMEELNKILLPYHILVLICSKYPQLDNIFTT